MKGVVLSGGHGTRLRPLTHTGPKQLIPIANKPNILYCLEDLRDAGITEIGVILGDIMPERVREALGNGAEWDVNLTYIEQGAPRGIAHAIQRAEEFVGEEPFCVYLGDNLLKGSIRPMVEEFRAGEHDAGVLLARVPHPERFGVVEVDADGRVLSLVEKPKKPRSELALTGIYLLRPSIFPVIHRLKPSWRNELEITEALDNLRAEGGELVAHIVTGWWKDTGRPEDILEANRLLLDDLEAALEGTVEKGARVEGRVQIGADSLVKEGSVVKGPTIIGRECVIGPDTYVGPYTAIGDNCQLVGADIEDSIVIGDSVIETPNKIVNSLIGRHTTILAANNRLPRGQRLVVGENSTLVL